MKTIIALFVGSLLIPDLLFSQSTFTSNFNIGSIKSFVISNDDKCVLLSDNGSVRITETDTSSGTIHWNSQILFPGHTISTKHIIRAADGNFVALLTPFATPYEGISALKLNSSGTLLWVKKYFAPLDNVAWNLIQTPDSGYIMVGGGCAGDNIVIRCDAMGDIVWQKQFIDTSAVGSTAMNISYAGNDNYYIAGDNINTNNDHNIDLFKITGSGNLIWYRKIIMAGTTWNHGLVTSNDGGATLAGWSHVLDSNRTNTYLSHFDSSGNNLWHKVYVDNQNGNHGNDLIQLDDGSYIITGDVSYTDNRNGQLLNFKTDSNGNFIWARTGSLLQNGGGYDDSFSIRPLSATSILTGGNYTFSKLNSSGYGWCYSDTVSMSAITPIYAIETPVYILNWYVNFIADTIAYTYNMYSGSVPPVCTNITGVSEATGFENIVSVSPNPFSDVLRISVNDNLKYHLIIYDIALRRSLQEDFTNSVSLNTEHFSKGIYFYEMSGDDGSVYKGKIVKN